jgi:hypothetical protein
MFMMGFVKERGKGVGQRESATKAHAPRQLVQKISQIITQLAHLSKIRKRSLG